ncbi:hypothetical protein DLD99_10990 [Pseudomonas kribbensis]|uniref:Uncharacterized protein n=1 Tax=Pseudomonas kribbensis TaxID=1628086 RepID=A0A345RNV8_9PSED|nr:hypothetical protein [Pseudomonas kribbensis]AXI60974.1 hypothetical protein DLD99_10990 [Pseudomonas kribbensis]
MANDEKVITANGAMTLMIEGHTNSYGKVVAYYKKAGEWIELGRGDVEAWEPRPPHPYKILVQNPSKDVHEIVVCSDKVGPPPQETQSPTLYV